MYIFGPAHVCRVSVKDTRDNQPIRCIMVLIICTFIQSVIPFRWRQSQETSPSEEDTGSHRQDTHHPAADVGEI